MASEQEKRAASEAAKILEESRATISEALAFLQRANFAQSALSDANLSFETSLQEAILEIDSQPDIVDPYLDSYVNAAPPAEAYSFGSLQSQRRVGKLQRLRNLKVALFGGTAIQVVDGVEEKITITGILDKLKEVNLTPDGTEEL